MRRLLLTIVPVVILSAGCGGSSKTGAPAPVTTSTPPPAATTSPPPSTPPPSVTSPSALQVEATSAAAGDIPDNQVFLVFRDRAGGYSIKYPEGWAQQGSGGHVTFRDKNNVVRIVVLPATRPPNKASIRTELATLRGAHVQSGPQPFAASRSHGFKVVYTTESAPNAVTGKRVQLVVDRYYVARPGKEAVVDLGTPQGVDNVDAYRLMIDSFRWR